MFASRYADQGLTNSGDNYSAPGYPSDLAPLPGSPDFIALERSGLIAEFEFFRGTGIVVDRTIIKQGTKEQCWRDNCFRLLESAVDRCK